MLKKPRVALAMVAHATLAVAADEAPAEPPAADAEPTWNFSITAYPTQVRRGDGFTSGVAIAERGRLHLEARYSSFGYTQLSAAVTGIASNRKPLS